MLRMTRSLLLKSRNISSQSFCTAAAGSFPHGQFGEPPELKPISSNPAANRASYLKDSLEKESDNVTHRQKVLNGEISLPSHFGHHLREAGANRSKAQRRRV